MVWETFGFTNPRAAGWELLLLGGGHTHSTRVSGSLPALLPRRWGNGSVEPGRSKRAAGVGYSPGGWDFGGSPPPHAKRTARLSAAFIISQDLWRKTKSRAALVINQEFFTRFPSCFLGISSSGPPTPAAFSLQAKGAGVGGWTPGF